MDQTVPHGLSFTGKLILFFMVLLILSSAIIGLTAFFIARNELNDKGQQILSNGVIQAIDLIESEYAKVVAGISTVESAQEHVKTVLAGPRNSLDGTRRLHHHVDLGKNGYFIIYDSRGNEVMHPSMEGQNVWDVTDLKDEQHFIVQKQIAQGKSGGGFLYYSWYLPDTDTVREKVSYSAYFAPWDWTIVATAYNIDFNRAARKILLVVGLTIALLALVLSAITLRFVRRLTAPVLQVVRGMEGVGHGKYLPVKKTFSGDEIDYLINGYNHMIHSLETAEKDIAKNREYITYLAFHDDLTGLPNRHGMESYIDGRIREGCRQAFMVQVDLIGLKVINSTQGYEQGDRLLKVFGEYFNRMPREDFFISRTGSNEFTGWIENIEPGQIRQRLDSLRERVKKHLSDQGYGQIIDAFIVIAGYPSQGASFKDLYEKASMAMKSAKDSGDLSITEYSSTIQDAVRDEYSMRQYLKQAIDGGELTAHYQEQIDYIDKEVIGVEALARWNSPVLGPVPPSVFIPAINKLNYIKEFSEYMIGQVLGDYRKLKEKYGKEISVSINISPSYFMNRDMLKTLESRLAEHQVPPEKLVLEVTEEMFITDFETTAEMIRKLHKMGIRISIDDFGTGFSSLNYLTRMDFDEMKIDKSFINTIVEDPKAYQLFQVMCDIAGIYGYEIVAEGVENLEQLEKIKATPLRIVQGYLFSKPEPLG